MRCPSVTLVQLGKHFRLHVRLGRHVGSYHYIML